MITNHETFEKITLEEMNESKGSHQTLMGSVMKSFYAQQENQRNRAAIAARRDRNRRR
jgi:hypothetical protein